MTEEEKKEFEEFLEWKRAKKAAQENNTTEHSEQTEQPEDSAAASTANEYSKTEKSATPPPPPSQSLSSDDKKAGCGKIIMCIMGGFVALFVFAKLLGTCVGGAPVAPASNDYDSLGIDTVAADTTVFDNSKPSSCWYYSEETDEMTDKKAYFATVTSTNSEEFDFPYQGGARLMLTVRKSPKFGNDIYIRISKGQFHSSINGTNIKVRFDDDPQFNVYCNEASDGSSDILFLSGYSKLVAQLKTHKTMKINAEFFQEGNRTFTFDISNFEWDH